MIPTTSTNQDTSVPPRGRRLTGITAGLGAALLVVTGVGAWSVRAPSGPDAPAPSAAAATPARVSPDIERGPAVPSYAELVEKVSPAVVTIRAERTVQPTGMDEGDELFRRFFGQGMPRGRAIPRREGGMGSGAFVTADGFILTNNHVVEGAQKVRVELTDGRVLDAKVIGTDQPSDLAVLKVSGNGFPVIPIGDSDKARIGDVVLALGNPLGIGQTVTSGIISAKGRATGGRDTYEDFLQTDAAINKGNSGGPLVNLRGELIGINSQILSPSGFSIGIGFAIPSSMAQDVMQQLIKTGKVQRGRIGVVIQPVTADLAKSLSLPHVRGAIVSDVTSGSPAERAGIEQGDVILAVDGSEVADYNALRNRVSRVTPGSPVTLKVLRDGRERDVKVTVEAMDRDVARNETPDAPDASRGRYGLTVEPLTPEIARELRVKSETGVVIAGVEPGSPAAEAGLQEGDVILRANQQKVADADQLRKALDAATGDKPALLVVSRQGTTVFVTVQKNG